MRAARLLLLGFLGILHFGAAESAVVQIVNADGPGEGLNDATPVAPVGGNPGTTRGQQRLNVLQHAANVWGSILPSNVAIRVQARFDPQTCTSTAAVLGSAGAIQVVFNFPGAPFSNTHYQIALANKLANVDLEPALDDITATFNSSIDSGCFGPGLVWYYGLDGAEGPNLELLPVVLHELAHGLGFSALVNLGTGEFPCCPSLPTIYSRFTLDTSTGLHWNNMSNSQRVASAINTGGLVWSGAGVTAQAPATLERRRILTVHSPAAVAGSYWIGPAAFGPAVTSPVATANVVLANDGVGVDPNDACEALVNGAQLAGKIAMINRGNCSFAFKATAAQNAGAVGVVIADNLAGPIPPDLGGSGPAITIPVVGLSKVDSDALKVHLGAGLNATLGGLHPTLSAGADNLNRAYLFAPNPVQTGSSVSHFDRSAIPNLLMEPSVNADLHVGIDLTLDHFRDIGWFTGVTGVYAAERAPVRLRSAPSPFDAATTVSFMLEQAGPVSLEVFGVDGRRVRRLVRGSLAAGLHAVPWDGLDDGGRRVSPGVYLLRFSGGGRTETGRTARIH